MCGSQNIPIRFLRYSCLSAFKVLIKRALSEYSAFMERVSSCIRDGILSDFLIRHKAEVMDVVLTEYDEAKHIKLIEKEAEARGEAIGQIKGAIKLARLDHDSSDREIVRKIVDLFELSEDEAWGYVRGCE